ncbi:hypothetical protein [Candidatus Minimicrobia naudis]
MIGIFGPAGAGKSVQGQILAARLTVGVGLVPDSCYAILTMAN